MKIKRYLLSSTVLTSKGFLRVRVPALALWEVFKRLPDIRPLEQKWQIARSILQVQIEQASKVRY